MDGAVLPQRALSQPGRRCAPTRAWKPSRRRPPSANPTRADAHSSPFSGFIEYGEPPGWKTDEPKHRWEIGFESTGEGDRVRYIAGLWYVANPSKHEDQLTSSPSSRAILAVFSTPRPDTSMTAADEALVGDVDIFARAAPRQDRFSNSAQGRIP